MKNKLHGFTILELMVAMGIIVFIMSLGVGGLISFRNNLDLQNIVSDTQSAIETIENNARNSRIVDERGSATVDPITAEYYIINFNVEDGLADYKLMYLEDKNSIITLLPNERENNLNNAFANFEIQAFGGLRETDCYNIGFKRSTTEMVAVRAELQGNPMIIETGRCELTITRDNVESDYTTITFDIDANKTETGK